MSDHISPLISVPGWSREGGDRRELERELIAWERSLDVHFVEKMDTQVLFWEGMSYMDFSCMEDLPELISWRELIGVRLISLDVERLRVLLSPEIWGNFLPAICFSLAIWGENLSGVREHLEPFLMPFNNNLIMAELSGYGEAFDPDERFYACLNGLTKEQRNCIAQFVEFYFGMYKSSFPWYTERSKAAAEELARIWRGE